MCGATFRFPCLMLPWLVVTLLEHLVVGVPLIVFFGIISLYLAAQLQLYFIAGALIGGIIMLFVLSLSSWFTVHSCYNMFYRRMDYIYCEAPTDVTQPLLQSQGGTATRTGPPAHPLAQQDSRGSGYHLGQYPQYYPPHHGHQQRQLPTAPPTSNSGGGGGVYPHLPSA